MRLRLLSTSEGLEPVPCLHKLQLTEPDFGVVLGLGGAEHELGADVRVEEPAEDLPGFHAVAELDQDILEQPRRRRAQQGGEYRIPGCSGGARSCRPARMEGPHHNRPPARPARSG